MICSCGLMDILMAQFKIAITPLLTHRNYCSLALSHPYANDFHIIFVHSMTYKILMVKNINVLCSTWFQVLENHVPYAINQTLMWLSLEISGFGHISNHVIMCYVCHKCLNVDTMHISIKKNLCDHIYPCHRYLLRSHRSNHMLPYMQPIHIKVCINSTLASNGNF